MSINGIRIPIGAEGTCPQCKAADATQKVSVITHAFADALTPAEFEAIEFSRARGDIKEWTAPRGTSWDAVTQHLALPSRPLKPWVLRLALNSLRGRFFLIILIFIVSILIAGALPISFWLRGLASLVITIASIGFLFSYYGRKQKAYDAQLLAWGAMKSKWTELRYCARDNIVFRIGQAQVLRTEQVQSFLNNPD